MQEELITFETAKLAKEKGFDEICYYLHHPLYGVVDNSKYHKNSKLNVSDKDKTEYVTAPTQSLLQKWLREVHNIHPEIHNLSIKWWLNLKEIDSDNAALFISDNYNSYEEALEIGLQEALKLIEIVKEKK
jgi:hypothetical protein